LRRESPSPNIDEDVALHSGKPPDLELDAAGIDMREPYKSATNSAIPNADVCIDPVHVKFVSRALNELENQ
jgi:hypothetical protein